MALITNAVQPSSGTLNEGVLTAASPQVDASYAAPGFDYGYRLASSAGVEEGIIIPLSHFANGQYGTTLGGKYGRVQGLIYFEAFPGAGVDVWGLRMMNYTSTLHQVKFYSNGTFQCGTAGGTSTATLSTATWYAFDYYCDAVADTQSISFYSWPDMTLIETETDTAVVANTVNCFEANANVDTFAMRICNLIMAVDDTNAIAQMYSTAWAVRHKAVTGQGSDNGWTGTYADVDEIPASDADYIYAQDVLDETVTLESCATAGITGTIAAVVVRCRAWEASSTTSALRGVRVVSGATTSETDSLNGSTTAYGYAKCHTVDPNTAAAWTAANLDSAEFGIGNDNTPGAAVRCSAIVVEVVSDLTEPATPAPPAISSTGYGDFAEVVSGADFLLQPHITVYNNLTQMVPVAELGEGVTVNEFTTQVHGGYGQIEFSFAAPWLDALVWYKHRYFCPLVARDQYGDTFFEGRIEDATVDLAAGGITVNITAFGHWRSCMDITHNGWHSQAKTTADWATTDTQGDLWNGVNGSRAWDTVDHIGMEYLNAVLATDWRGLRVSVLPFDDTLAQFNFTHTFSGTKSAQMQIWAIKATTTIGRGTPGAGGGVPEGSAGTDYELLFDQANSSAGDQSKTLTGTGFTQLYLMVKPNEDFAVEQARHYLTNTDIRSQAGRDTSDVLKRILTKSCPSISSDQSNVDDSGAEMKFPVVYEDDKFSYEIIEDLGSYGDDSTPPINMWFAVWKNRKPYLKRQKTTIDWDASADCTEASLSTSVRDFRSRVTGKYTDIAGETQRTATETDSTAEAKYIRRDYTVAVSTQAETDAARLSDAERIRGRYADEYGSRKQDGEITVRGYVTDGAGNRIPLWRVKAGETIRLRWLEEGLVTAVDGISAFHIVKTSYSPESNTLSITPTGPSNSLDIEIARLALPT